MTEIYVSNKGAIEEFKIERERCREAHDWKGILRAHDRLLEQADKIYETFFNRFLDYSHEFNSNLSQMIFSNSLNLRESTLNDGKDANKCLSNLNNLVNKFEEFNFRPGGYKFDWNYFLLKIEENYKDLLTKINDIPEKDPLTGETILDISPDIEDYRKDYINIVNILNKKLEKFNVRINLES